VSEILVKMLADNDVEFVFYNPGYDVVPIISEINKFRRSGVKAPKPILCLDESVALASAHGNFLITGKKQIVLVHSELGTQQIGGALHQAQWGHVPVLLCAGIDRMVNRKNWMNDPYDQGSMVRNCVKWDCMLNGPEELPDILNKAFKITATDPCGPVYLCFNRDHFLMEIDENLILSPKKHSAAKSITKKDMDLLKKAAILLIKAKNPLILTGHSGRNLNSVSALIHLAETLGARVYTAPVRVNFPSDHPLCAGVEPNDGLSVSNPYFSTSDVLFVIDYDLPYAPPNLSPGLNSKIVHIDMDFIKNGRPLWGRNADICLKTDSSKAIPALCKMINELLTPKDKIRLHDRYKRYKNEHELSRNRLKTLSINSAKDKPISPDWLSYCVNEVMDDNTILINQTISGSLSISQQISRNMPGTMFACTGGSIGWALPAALGAKLAAPDNLVISLMGDGAFIYGCPVATLWTSNKYQAPFLSIIYNNQAYGAIKGLLRKEFKMDSSGGDIFPSPDFSLVANACRAYGRQVVDPNDIVHELKKAIQYVKKGVSAVLDVRIKQI